MKWNKKWSDRKIWIMGIVGALISSIVVSLVMQLTKNDHIVAGESRIFDEYYLEMFSGNKLESQAIADSFLKLSELSFRYDEAYETPIMRSSSIKIGYSEDQVILARHQIKKDYWIVALDLLSGQGEKMEFKREVDALKSGISNRFTNIDMEFLHYGNPS